MSAVFSYIRRFGFWRGIEFRRVAAKCDRNQRLLRSCASQYRAKASREFLHDNSADGRAYLAFAELLDTSYNKLVLRIKPRQPILNKRQRRLQKVLAKLKERRLAT